MRFTFFAPIVLLYAIFLLTEDYFFAALRGAALAAYLVLLFTVLPFSYFDRLRLRVIALILGVLGFSVYVWLLSFAIQRSSTTGSRLSKLSVLYDPIGAELEKSVPERFAADLGLAQPAEFRAILALASSGKTDSTNTVIYYRADSMTAIAARWMEHRDDFRRALASRGAEIKNRVDSAEYETTKRFLAAQLQRLSMMDDFASKLDRYASAPRAATLVEFYEPFSRLQKAEIAEMEMTISNSRIRRRLVELGLLDPTE
jgi:hypothetical protein